MSMHFRNIADQAVADGVISADEILSLRRESWSDGQICADEAEAIFLINDHIDVATGEWMEFFIEAMGEYIVNTLEPRGYVTQDQADWLIAKIDHDGNVNGVTELELLVHVFEKSTSLRDAMKSDRDLLLNPL